MVQPSDGRPLAVDRLRVAQEWRRRGFIPGHATYPPGRARADAVRDEDELVMLVEGEVELVLEGDVRRLAPGEEHLIPAGVRHTLRNVGSTPSRWLHAFRN